MKIIRLFIPLLFLVIQMLPASAQNESKNDIQLPDAAASSVIAAESASPLKLSGVVDSGLIQIISKELERGAGNGSSFPSPMAVPANNDCANAITLTVNANCVNGTNKESTVQSGESTACQGAVTKTVWYKFIATASAMFVEVERTASSGCYLSSAVYSGSCLPSASISCEDAAGGPNLNVHNLTGLTIGSTYFVQVSYTGGGPCGNNNNAGTGADFCIRAGTPVICATCNTTCGPVCVFPTTPTVAQVTSTCTAYLLKPRLNAGQSRTQCYTFTAVASNFSLQMIINSVGCGVGGNVSSFNWQLYPSTCSGVVQSGTLSNLNANGLTIGASYVLCYTWVSLCQHNSVYPYIVATSPLPVELLMFEGKRQEKGILLNWSTASELNNNYFSVQRSADGIVFEEIGKVTGFGNSTQIREYSFTDNLPVNGINYYRLEQVDYDGNSEFSKIVAIRHIKDSNILVENNPVSTQLQINIQSGNASHVTFEIINNLGDQVIQTTRFANKGQNIFQLPVENLAKGVYFLKTETNLQTSWIRFVKL